MIKHPRILFLIADGGRARLVMRGPSGHFATISGLSGEKPPPAGGRGAGAAVFQRFGHGVHATQRAPGAEGRHEAEFARRAADEAVALIREHEALGVVVVAPARLQATLKAQIDGRCAILGALAKDLDKTPDHELHAWLDSAELEASGGLAR